MIEQIINYVRENWLPILAIILYPSIVIFIFGGAGDGGQTYLGRLLTKRMTTTQKYREGLIKK